MQKDHDLSDHLLRPPGIDNPRRPHGTNPVHLAEAVRRVLDEVKDLVAKGLDELPGVDGPDAANHSRGEVLLNALDGRRRRRPQKARAELHPVRPIVGPFPGGRDPLARRDGRRIADHRRQVPVTAGLHAQHAKSVLLVVEGHPFDETRQNFSVSRPDLGTISSLSFSSHDHLAWIIHQ